MRGETICPICGEGYPIRLSEIGICPECAENTECTECEEKRINRRRKYEALRDSGQLQSIYSGC